MRIKLCRHTGGLKDEVIELDVSANDYRTITDYAIVTYNDVVYTRDSSDRSVFFSAEVMKLDYFIEAEDEMS